jgi:hypothetical protein|tara:strand:- start:872 stop:1477 length:606 start_codon:yes stop_codon:yes gene_type:complete
MATIGDEIQRLKSDSSRPMAGSSLANDPENPAPFEKAPKFTSVHAASEDIFIKLIEPQQYVAIMEAVDGGIPVMQITQMILYKEFQQGAFNPDLMMMMVEPVAYMIIALAERLDLDIVINDEDEDDEEVFGVNFKEDKLKELKGAASTGAVPAGMLSSTMKEQMDILPESLEETSESLLAPPVVEEAPEETETPESLMARR